MKTLTKVLVILTIFTSLSYIFFQINSIENKLDEKSSIEDTINIAKASANSLRYEIMLEKCKSLGGKPILFNSFGEGDWALFAISNTANEIFRLDGCEKNGIQYKVGNNSLDFVRVETVTNDFILGK